MRSSCSENPIRRLRPLRHSGMRDGFVLIAVSGSPIALRGGAGEDGSGTTASLLHALFLLNALEMGAMSPAGMEAPSICGLLPFSEARETAVKRPSSWSRAGTARTAHASPWLFPDSTRRGISGLHGAGALRDLIRRAFPAWPELLLRPPRADPDPGIQKRRFAAPAALPSTIFQLGRMGIVQDGAPGQTAVRNGAAQAHGRRPLSLAEGCVICAYRSMDASTGCCGSAFFRNGSADAQDRMEQRTCASGSMSFPCSSQQLDMN